MTKAAARSHAVVLLLLLLICCLLLLPLWGFRVCYMFVVHCFAFFLNYLDREERERRGVERVRVRERDREREPVALLCFSF